jgi:hypothetical protein
MTGGRQATLTVQQLMLAELLERDHGRQARACKAVWDRTEMRWRLRDRLAGPAGEALAYRLDERCDVSNPVSKGLESES